MSEPVKKSVTPLHRSPIAGFPRFDQEIERFFGGRWPRSFDWPTVRAESLDELPNIDVIDRESEICVRAELPGFKKEEIEVTVNHDTLTVKAQSSKEEAEEEGDYVHKEMTRSYLARTVSLPAEVSGDSAKASLSDGVLEVIVPKAEVSKRQHISIE